MDEKMLPLGEPALHFAPASGLVSAEPVAPVHAPAPEPAPAPVITGMPSPAQQQWGVVISIVIIVLMVIIGAFYAWGQRIAENQYPAATTE